MNRRTVLLAAAVIFACGAVTGALALRTAQDCARTTDVSKKHVSPIDARFDALKQMQSELDLTPDQTNRIDAILESSRKRMRQIWETTCQPPLREEMKQVHARIQAELNPVQKAKYDQLLKRSKSFKEHHGSRSPEPTHLPDNRGDRDNATPDIPKTQDVP